MKIIELFDPGIGNPVGKFLFASILGSLSVCSISNAQTISTNGAMLIGPGVVVNSSYAMSLQGGGTLNVQGTLILKNNLINQKTVPDSLGTGTIEFSGTTPQTVSGPNVFKNLKIDNSTGVSLTGGYDNQVNGTLTLSSGLLTLGARNLLLGTDAAVAQTPAPTASNMVVATGNGELRKSFSAPASFTYPVGDNTVTPEYSPVTMNFASGTFGSGNYAGVSLADAKYNNDSITGNYLTRYWALSQLGISTFTCNATFKYLPSDVNGAESSIYCVKADPSPWVTYNIANTGSHELTANGLSSFSTFTGAGGGMDLGLTAFLEGPFTAGAMTTTLNTSGLIPLTQPYNTAPWNYSGPESVTSIPAGVVDWVLVELRQAGTPAGATSSTILKKRAAFIRSNGIVVDLDGTSPVRFYNTSLTANLYPVLRHRNHVAIMANNAVNLIDGVFTYNYSTNSNQAYGGTNGTKQISLGVWGLYSADANNDGSVYANDYTGYWLTDFGSHNYNKGDFNMDGYVYATDYTNFWVLNFGKTNQLP